MLKSLILPSKAQFDRAQVNLKPKLSTWSILLVAIAVASMSATAIYQLNQIAERNSNTRLLLTQVKEQVSRLNALEWEGISKGKIDENLTEELAENKQSTDAIFNELQQIERQNDLSNFFAFYKRYKTEIDRVLVLIAQGNTKEAIDVDADGIDEIYDALYAEVANLEKSYIEQQKRTRVIADIGTTFSLILSAVIIGVLFHKFSKSLWDKNYELAIAFQELQKTQNQLIQQEKWQPWGNSLLESPMKLIIL